MSVFLTLQSRFGNTEQGSENSGTAAEIRIRLIAQPERIHPVRISLFLFIISWKQYQFQVSLILLNLSAILLFYVLTSLTNVHISGKFPQFTLEKCRVFHYNR